MYKSMYFIDFHIIDFKKGNHKGCPLNFRIFKRVKMDCPVGATLVVAPVRLKLAEGSHLFFSTSIYLILRRSVHDVNPTSLSNRESDL
jgi:hypothetical protein